MTAEQILRSKNLRVTEQRKIILDMILSSENRLSAYDIQMRLRQMKKSFGLATVYRTLTALEEGGVIKKSEMPSDDCAFYSCDTGHKHCFVCTECKHEIEIDLCPINHEAQQLAQKMDFEITGHSFEIFGICKDCKIFKK